MLLPVVETKKPRAINSGLLPYQASMQTLNIICGRVAWTSIWAAQFAFAPSIHKMYYFDFANAMLSENIYYLSRQLRKFILNFTLHCEKYFRIEHVLAPDNTTPT
ncbi:hypothetical protein DOX69_22505 [Cronobacter sakazakii]|nr:hypothetical protein [Cronobacter sakazakii]EGT4286563.1 hypothetical protein [Cronobacter sakazakii]EGT4295066.1 hypothetical protein [Cronobacter sakazakii]PUY54741.1 hypothetical protein B8W50_20705 [Cronobacter sakazakii]